MSTPIGPPGPRTPRTPPTPPSTSTAGGGPVNGSVGGTVAGLASRAASDPPGYARRVAAIDCGTNSLRLLIADEIGRAHV